ncbi:hypothetical protein EHS25_002611 [Saitozyma podzolica]|uniref:Uncharacterized protein n=1 Tax=Saitozyma podzolica TaxID=1890683 RepID=A0A427YCP8_9TREE|nr:hypothetical protein EHS25_002611 [Saitozyma podzolica]
MSSSSSSSNSDSTGGGSSDALSSLLSLCLTSTQTQHLIYLDVGLVVLCVVTFLAWLKLRRDTHDIGEQLVHHYEAVHEAEHEGSKR